MAQTRSVIIFINAYLYTEIDTAVYIFDECNFVNILILCLANYLHLHWMLL